MFMAGKLYAEMEEGGMLPDAQRCEGGGAGMETKIDSNHESV